MKKHGKTATKTGGEIGKLAKRLIGAAAAYKAFRLAVSSVREFAKFQKGMANVSTMLNEQTRKLLPKYTKQIIALTKEYGQNAEVLSLGLYDILSASIDASQAMGVLEIATQAAIGGMTDTAVAADAITTVLNSYSLAASEAGRASDVLFAIVKRGKITFGELASGIGKVSSIAAASGLSIEEVGAAIATMTRAGIQSDIAMTSLRAILMTFLSPTRENIQAAKALGFELNITTLKSEGLTGVIQKLIGKSPSSVAGAFSNARGLAGLAALIGSAEGHLKDLGTISDSSGDRLEAFGEHVDTVAQQLAKANQQWAGFKRGVGEYFVLRAGEIADIAGAAKEVHKSSVFWRGTAADTGPDLDSIKESNKSIGQTLKDLEGRTDAQIKRFIKMREVLGERVHPRVRQLLEPSFDEAEQDRTLKSRVDFRAEFDEELVKSDTKEVEEELKRAASINKLTKEHIKVLEDEKALIGLTADERARHNDVLRFEQIATKELGEDIEDISKAYQKALDELVALQKAQSKKEIVARYFGTLEKERELLGLTSDERERAIELQRFENELKAAGVEVTKELTNAYKDQLGANQRAGEQAERDASFVKRFEEDRKNILRGPLIAMLEDRELEEVFKESVARLGTTVVEHMYEKTIVEPLMEILEDTIDPAMEKIASMIMEGLAGVASMAVNLLSSILGGVVSGIGGAIGGGLGGLFGGAGGAAASGAGSITGAGISGISLPAANGLVFNNASVTPFASGGVLDGPTVFPMANGGLALGGEAGHEGLLPLERDSKNRLSVHTTGDGESGKTPIKIINVMDMSQVQEYLGTGDGERQIVNIMRRNAGEVTNVSG
jgi:TP901 family phage tail tape measure protein